MGLARKTDATLEPLTTAEAKLHLRVDHALEDAYIDGLVKAARLRVERELRRALVTQTWTYTLERFPVFELRLPRPPLQSITSIIYLDGDGASQTLVNTKYRVTTNGTPGRVEPVYGETWPITRRTSDAVSIEFIAGYGSAATSVPEDARAAIRWIVGHLYKHREAVTEANLVVLPLGIKWLLDPLRYRDLSYAEACA